ncbi:hypothetical protein ACFQX6_20120 [Streptosporangium lutulentum]
MPRFLLGLKAGVSTLEELMTRIAAVHGALPPNRYSQAEITDTFAQVCLPSGAVRAA